MTYEKHRKKIQPVCEEVDSFNGFFAGLLRKHVYGDFKDRLKECVESNCENIDEKHKSSEFLF